MLKKLILRRLAGVERDTGYDVQYLRDMLEADLKAFLCFSKITAISQYRRDLPSDASFAAKLVGTLVEDCGPCTQLMVAMAEREGVRADTLRAVLCGDDAALSADVRLSVRFARASLARDPAVDELRDQVISRWGKRGLVSLAFALVASRVFPTLKYALGHGRTCSRVVVAGTPMNVHGAAVASAVV